ncbi:MAG TPA: hypothetical protein VGO59_04935 [Verrucomicrobiae bacterium]
MASPVLTGETAQPKAPKAEAKPLFEPLPAGGCAEPAAKDCGRPAVTLQRQGEVVSGIRIECGCGQVIELACAY